MKVTAIFKWMLYAMLAIALIAGAGGVWLWQNGGDLIRLKVLQTFDRAAPDLELHFDELRLLSVSSAQLIGVELRDRSTNRPVLRAKVVEAEVDEPLLVERQQIVLRSLMIQGIDILLKRDPGGRWNWQDYQFHRITEGPLIPPAITLTTVQVQMHVEHGEGIPPASLVVSTPLFQALPTSADAYDFSGVLELPGAGDLALDGDCDLKSMQWKLGGRLKDVKADQSLLELAHSTVPQWTGRLQELDAAMARVLPSPSENSPAERNPSTDSGGRVSSGSSAMVIGLSDHSPRFLGVLDIDFQVQQQSGSPVPELRLEVGIREGQLSSPIIPIRLSDLTAKLSLDNQHMVVQLLNARDGSMAMTGEFRMQLGDDAPPPEASIHLEQFPVTMELKPLMPLKTQRFFDQFQPHGTVTGDIRLQRLASGKWLPVAVSGTADKATVLFHRFRQPVTGISAKLVQRTLSSTAQSLADVIFDVHAEGLIGSRPISATGWLRNPGPELELRFDLQVSDLPIDSRFRDALDDQGRRVMESLNLSGTATSDISCYREPGLDKPTDLFLRADVRDAKLRFRGFPYEIDQLSGHVEFKSKEKHWTFTNLAGRHGPGELTGFGTFRGLPSPGTLELTVKAERAQLDDDLYNALSPPLRAVWTMLDPEGLISLTSRIDWTAAPGQRPVVSLPEIRVTDAEINPKAFPYRMSVSSARVSYDPNDPRSAGCQHCEIHELKAEHEGSPISATGWAEVAADGMWQLHLNDLNATDLPPDDELRSALPDSWRDTLSRLSQDGQVSVEASELDFRGMTTGDAPPTAAWKMNLRLRNCSVSAGLDLKRISGLVKANGTWDGYHLRNEGTIRLDQVEVLDMTVAGISGPYRMSEEELVLGSREVILGSIRPQDVRAEDHVQGQAYGGTLELDGIIDLTAGSNYRFFGELKNALLEQYAARHMPDQPGLRGVMNSWLFVFGEGDSPEALEGRGQMLISPAALFELPVVLELMTAMQSLDFTVPKRTAFNYALMSFDVRNEAFLFDRIDLAGEAMSLRGRGTVGFGGDVVLDFYSRPARPGRLRLPLTDLATQWVNVQVRGTVDRPQTNVGSRPQLDDSMRQFLSTFNPSPGGPIPGLVLPNVLRFPMAPQAVRP